MGGRRGEDALKALIPEFTDDNVDTLLPEAVEQVDYMVFVNSLFREAEDR